MKVYLVPSWCMPFGYGIALWKVALVDKNSSDLPYVVMHEVCHLKQFKDFGFWKFMYHYFRENIKVGYEDNSFEKEARVYGRAYKHLYKDYI